MDTFQETPDTAKNTKTMSSDVDGSYSLTPGGLYIVRGKQEGHTPYRHLSEYISKEGIYVRDEHIYCEGLWHVFASFDEANRIPSRVRIMVDNLAFKGNEITSQGHLVEKIIISSPGDGIRDQSITDFIAEAKSLIRKIDDPRIDELKSFYQKLR